MTGLHDVDWVEVERRGRRQNWLAFPLLPLFFAAVVLLTGGYAFWQGTGAWVAVGAFALSFLGMQVMSAVAPRFRARAAQGIRIQYALRHQVDPGPELREKADRYARRMVSHAWTVWLFPLLPLSFLLTGRWDRPLVAVPAALVVVGCAVAMALWWRRQTTAAARWLADRPGPDRELPPPDRYERWFTGRRFVWLMVAAVPLGAVVGLAMILTDRLTS